MANTQPPKRAKPSPTSPVVFSDSTLEIFNQVLSTQQISVGDPTFLDVAAKVVTARTELNAAMKDRGLLEE
jgi:hypothetical protein